LLAFGLIAIAMILICRSLGLGVIAMLPNIFPTLLLFGGMGLLGFTLDSGAMITTTVALGIAVDDTSHFLWWFSRCNSPTAAAEAASESPRETANAYSMIHRAFGHCATPMLRTTLICGLGIGMFAFSPFLPVAKFGALMTLLLLAALVGDLILLPALLALAHSSKQSQAD
jgi:predicted RND superfamily exporter protein